MERNSTLPGNDRLPLHPLRVFRVDPGRAAIIRLTGHRMWGMFTHYVRRSIYCAGEGVCQASIHRTPKFWRGYAAAEVWQQSQGSWDPVALEFTEHLELDFRGRFARGQVWEISRAAQIGKKHQPTCGELLEQRDPRSFPAALDLLPCLLHLYHCEALDLDTKNPLPPRTMVGPSAGDGPAKLKKLPCTDQASTAEISELVKKVQERMRIGNDELLGNGKAHN